MYKYNYFVSLQVSENGVISFGNKWFYDKPERFPTQDRYIQDRFVLAPYWSDNDIRRDGTVRYVVIKNSRDFSIGSDLLDKATSLRSKQIL